MLDIPLDVIGLMASLLCAIHCASIPVLLGFSALAGLHFLGSSWIEYLVVFISLLIGIISFIPSYRTQHRKLLPGVILTFGFISIMIGHIGLISIPEIALTVIGALFISFAHIINLRLVVKFKYGK